jgi:hypothetical protein
MGERRGIYRVLVGKPEGKRPLWRTWNRWEDNIKGVWIGSSWLRIGTGGGTCECGNEPLGIIKCGEFLD